MVSLIGVGGFSWSDWVCWLGLFGVGWPFWERQDDGLVWPLLGNSRLGLWTLVSSVRAGLQVGLHFIGDLFGVAAVAN